MHICTKCLEIKQKRIKLSKEKNKTISLNTNTEDYQEKIFTIKTCRQDVDAILIQLRD